MIESGKGLVGVLDAGLGVRDLQRGHPSGLVADRGRGSREGAGLGEASPNGLVKLDGLYVAVQRLQGHGRARSQCGRELLLLGGTFNGRIQLLLPQRCQIELPGDVVADKCREQAADDRDET